MIPTIGFLEINKVIIPHVNIHGDILIIYHNKINKKECRSKVANSAIYILIRY
nr:MAG TPA: hypothetical protein [Caudoviricetes sp.]